MKMPTVAQCLNYISDYHENALAKAENAGVGAALERRMMRIIRRFSM